MRIQLQTSGGIAYFPGLAGPRTIDVDALDPKTRDTIKRLIREADFFSLPAEAPVRPGAADHCTYQLTVEDGARRHSISVCDPVAPPPLQQLIDLLRTL
jgi:hypothetical protein